MFSLKLRQPVIEARRVFARLLEIPISVFQPHPKETVKMSQNMFITFDLSRVSFHKIYSSLGVSCTYTEVLLLNRYMEVSLK